MLDQIERQTQSLDQQILDTFKPGTLITGVDLQWLKYTDIQIEYEGKILYKKDALESLQELGRQHYFVVMENLGNTRHYTYIFTLNKNINPKDGALIRETAYEFNIFSKIKEQQ